MGRDTTKLHPYLLDHFRRTAAAFIEKYPDAPQPILSETYRSPNEQAALYAQGREHVDRVNVLRREADMPRINASENKKVTNARPDQSLHCYLPALAYDIAFRKADGTLDWGIANFRRFADIAKLDERVEWGGDWKTIKDNPHFQFTGYSWRDAKAGVDPLTKTEK